MMGYSILLEARAPERNILRSYHIAAGQDLFGQWIVELTYGRIGAKGRKKTILIADKVEAKNYVKRCLNRRKSSPKRLGVAYQIISTQGDWNA